MVPVKINKKIYSWIDKNIFGLGIRDLGLLYSNEKQYIIW